MKEILGLGSVEEAARRQGRVLVPIGSSPVELVAARFRNQVEVADAGILSRVIALHQRDLLIIMHVNAGEAGAVAGVAVDAFLNLTGRLARDLDSVDTARAL